jgi:hypothetical protein
MQLPHVGVVKWLDTTPEGSQYVSVLTLAEIEQGILRCGNCKQPPQRGVMSVWQNELACLGSPCAGGDDWRVADGGP